MINTEFYGGELKSLSYLEFGSINFQSGSKSVYEFQMHDKAYDWLMNGRYSNDIVAYKDMTVAIGDQTQIMSVFKEGMHHADDVSLNLSKLIALDVLSNDQQPTSFFELGQTLFGCIEGLEFVQAFVNQYQLSDSTVDLKEVNWLGMDISHYFNTLAPMMHSAYKVQTADSMDKLPKEKGVFFAKDVTLLYALRTPAQLFELLSDCQLGVFDYSLSMGETEERVIGTGKNATYLSKSDFLAACNESSGQMYVRKRTSREIPKDNRIHLDAVWGSEDNVARYIARDQQIRETAMAKLDSSVHPLFCQTESDDNQWITIEAFLAL